MATTSGRSGWPSRWRWRLARAGQHVMVLNPTTPIGARRCKADAYRADRGGLSESEVSGVCGYGVEPGGCGRDCADACGGAGAWDASGERYILGGENLTLKQILDRLAAITGLPSPTMKVPHAVAMAFAFFDETVTGKLAGQGAAGDGGGGAHGEEDDVCELGEGGAGAGVAGGECGERAAVGLRLVL